MFKMLPSWIYFKKFLELELIFCKSLFFIVSKKRKSHHQNLKLRIANSNERAWKNHTIKYEEKCNPNSKISSWCLQFFHNNLIIYAIPCFQVRNHKDDLLSYIIFLRITPFLPNWFINIAAPVVDVPLVPFYIGTFLGNLSSKLCLS